MKQDQGFSLWSRPVIGWAMFDFANTIFSFAVITRYFNEWITDDRGRPDFHIGLMSFAVGIALVMVMPIIGAISDQMGRRKGFLVIFAAVCICSTAILGGVGSTNAALVVAGVAIFFYQLSLSMYDPLLASVAPPEHRGTVSGLGVGLGYVGVLAGSVVLTWFVENGDRQSAFVPTAVLFAVFSLPLVLWVRESIPATGPGARKYSAALVPEALRQVTGTIRNVRSEHSDLARFLLARFLYVDSIATVIGFMTVYMGRLGGFTEADRTLVLAVSMVAAAVGAFVCGRLVESFGPRRILISILVMAAITLTVAGATGSGAMIWVLGPLVGITLGGVWTSDRVFMMRLSPPAMRGEFFALYNLVGKLSSGVGPLFLWGGTTWVLHDRSGYVSELAASRVALIVLACTIVIGLLVLRPLSDKEKFPAV